MSISFIRFKSPTSDRRLLHLPPQRRRRSHGSRPPRPSILGIAGIPNDVSGIARELRFDRPSLTRKKAPKRSSPSQDDSQRPENPQHLGTRESLASLRESRPSVVVWGKRNLFVAGKSKKSSFFSVFFGKNHAKRRFPPSIPGIGGMATRSAAWRASQWNGDGDEKKVAQFCGFRASFEDFPCPPSVHPTIKKNSVKTKQKSR